MVTDVITRSYKRGSNPVVQTVETLQGTVAPEFDKTIELGDTTIPIAFTRSKLIALMIYCDKAVTVFNRTPSPYDVVPIAAGQTLVWTLAKDTLDRCPFTDDAAHLNVWNESGGTAKFDMKILSSD